jgi:D-glycero-D-manno-heptose 1,7-bisphosphate phosphatase
VSGRWVEAWQHGPLALRSDGSAAAGVVAAADGRPAAFLDRDGVLNEGVPDPDSGLLESPLRVEDVRLLPGVPEALHELSDAGLALVCVSNQPAAAKGKSSLEEMLAVHERVLELLAREDVCLDASRLCPHHPEGIVAGLSGPCACRKPSPGMLLDAAHALGLDLGSAWMFGDTDTDMQAGRAVGCETVLIAYPGSSHKRSGRASPDLQAADLPGGVGRVLDHSRPHPRLSS